MAFGRISGQKSTTATKIWIDRYESFTFCVVMVGSIICPMIKLSMLGTSFDVMQSANYKVQIIPGFIYLFDASRVILLPLSSGVVQ